MQKILILDESPETCQEISQSLGENYQLVIESCPKNLMEHDLSEYSGFLVDIKLSNNGDKSIIKSLRNKLKSPTPLCLISDPAQKDKYKSYCDHQADELFCKEAPHAEIRGRFQAATQRVRNLYRHIEYGPIRVNLSKAKVWVEGEIFECTSTEYRILCSLINELDGKSFVPRADFIQTVWDGVSVEERTISTHLSNLNKKLKQRGLRIKTKRSQGLFIEFV